VVKQEIINEYVNCRLPETVTETQMAYGHIFGGPYGDVFLVVVVVVVVGGGVV
jgi:hypothetical protein